MRRIGYLCRSFFFFSSRRRHTRCSRDWSSDVCSSDLYVLAYQLGWFPVQGWGISFAENLLRYSVLAIIVGVAVSLAPDIRLYRSFFLDEINQDYVRTARAKGLSENRVMWVHVLRNAAIPIVTNILLQLPGLLAGAFLIE